VSWKAALRRVAQSPRKIVTETVDMPDDTAADRLLRERLELVAEILDATAGVTASDKDQGLAEEVSHGS